MRKPLIAEPSVLKKYFEAGRKENENDARDEQDNLQMGQGGKSTIYDWGVDEEVYLVVFNRQSVKIEDYTNSRSAVQEEGGQKQEDDTIGAENIDLGSLSRMPLKLRRAYERYFGGEERTTQFHRYDKLKVYDILSLSRQDEDDIVFLIERIASRSANTLSSEITFQNHLSIYPSLLNAPIDSLRYEILAQQLKEEINDPKLSFAAFLRMFVLENDFFSGELEKYFRQQYRVCGLLPHPQLFALGSYSKFDRAKAEMIFMDLLKTFLARN
jgi:hypothetical protein